MSKTKSTRATARKPRPTEIPPEKLMRYDPRQRSLVVSTGPNRYPHQPEEKVVCAKSIIQAVIGAHDAGALTGENYDIAWPLGLAVELLEQCLRQLAQAQS